MVSRTPFRKVITVKLRTTPSYALLIAWLTLSLLSGGVAATSYSDYDITFYQSFAQSSPQLANPNGTGGWPKVTSKWNQPRGVGSNPHRGTDLGIGLGSPVFAPYGGCVDSTGTSESGQKLALRLDTDSDTVCTDNFLWLQFLHIDPDDTTPGRYFSKGQRVGAVTSNHLYFGLVETLNSDENHNLWRANFPYYVNVADWEYGRDLDFLADVAWNTSSNILSLWAYVESDWNEFRVQKVRIYHRVYGSSSAWTTDWMSQVSGTDRWQYSLGGKYAVGTYVETVMEAYRCDADYCGTYNWGFFGAKYRHPAELLSNWPAGTSPSSYVVQIH